MGNEAMKPRPGPMRQEGAFYTRSNTRDNISTDNISITDRGVSFISFKGDPETTIRRINSIRVLKKDKKTENREGTIFERREAFHKEFPYSNRFRFNEQTGLVEKNPGK